MGLRVSAQADINTARPEEVGNSPNEALSINQSSSPDSYLKGVDRSTVQILTPRFRNIFAQGKTNESTPPPKSEAEKKREADAEAARQAFCKKRDEDCAKDPKSRKDCKTATPVCR